MSDRRKWSGRRNRTRSPNIWRHKAWMEWRPRYVDLQTNRCILNQTIRHLIAGKQKHIYDPNERRTMKKSFPINRVLIKTPRSHNAIIFTIFHLAFARFNILIKPYGKRRLTISDTASFNCLIERNEQHLWSIDTSSESGRQNASD